MRAVDYILIGALTIILALQLHLQFVQKINWDEFFYLSHIYDAQNGRLDKALQMGHVYLFGWLTHVPGGEMAQITSGRIVMWAVQLGTIILIVRTACKFMSLTAALVSALCFLGFGFIFIHGTSFRADPLAAFLMMFAVYVLAATELNFRDLASLSVALALGVFVTIKVILFAPLLAILALWRLYESETKGTLLCKFVAAALAALTLCLMALAAHRLTLQPPQIVQPSSSLSATFKTIFLSGGLFPRMALMKVGLFSGLLSSILIGLGIAAALWAASTDKRNRKIALIMLAMGIPLLSFVFYRNAYPYFYAFILPSAALLAGYGVHRLNISKPILLGVGLLVSANVLWIYGTRIDETRAVQAQILAAVHKIFPEPVHYFDRNGTIASFPKAGFFMSSWGLRNYKLNGVSRFNHELSRITIPLIIDNSPVISAALRGEPSELSETDAKVLNGNYIPHWGHIWVAGKTLSVSDNPVRFHMAVPGTYTLEAEKSATINQETYLPGNIVVLERGESVISSSIQQTITLRWGDNLNRPKFEASDLPIFGAF